MVQLNTQRGAEETQGRVRWLRPEFHNPQSSVQKQELLPQEDKAPEADSDSENPLSKPEQTKTAQIPWPPTLPAIEARFKGRGPWKKGLPTLLQTLEALGRAQAVHGEGGTVWRG